VLLESGGERLLCVGDTFYDPLQVEHPEWATPWDLDRPGSIASRRRILEWAADDRLLLHAYHLPFPGLGRVHRHGAAFAWDPLTYQPRG
jgi:glyoxylase-like metal-dependent hydrolase (beta-lactamase superfamily II)